LNPTRLLRTGVRLLSKMLVNMGHSVYIIQPIQLGSNLSYAIKGVKILPLPSLFIPKIRYTLPSILHQINKLVKVQNIDLLHMWSYFYIPNFLLIFLKDVLKIPIVASVDNLPGISWSYGSIRLIDILAKAYTYSLGKKTLIACDKVVLLYKKLMYDMVSLGIPSSRIEVIPNGIDLRKFNPFIDATKTKKMLGLKDHKIILFIGRLVPVKGLTYLFEAVEMLVKEIRDIKLIIAGDGPYRKEYEKVARPIEKYTLFLGFCNDIPQLLSASDVLVLPSVSEGWPAVILEAAACGKPAICSNVGGIPEMVIHGKTGYLINPGDVDALVYYLARILSSDSLKEDMGMAACKYVQEHFSCEVMVRKYLKLYNDLLSTLKK